MQHRRLSSTDLALVVSGSGWRGVEWGLPSGEANADMAPYYGRGLYPNPGIWDQMGRAEPMVSSGLRKQVLSVASLNWDILPPQEEGEPPSDEEKVQTKWIRRFWNEQPGGFIGSAVVRPMSSIQYGFSLQEIVLAIDEATGLWCLAPASPDNPGGGVCWVPPWSVYSWVLDKHGFPLGVILQDEIKSRQFVSWDKLHHEAQAFYGRNPEGISDLRAIRYTWQHKRQGLVDDAIGRENASSGLTEAVPPQGTTRQTNATDYAEMDQTCANIAAGDQSYVVYPAAGWEIRAKYLNAMPDNSKMFAYLDHQIATQLTDLVSELGNTTSGSRAVGSEMRLDKAAQLAGLCAMKAHNIDHQIHRLIYQQNGWDTSRMCRTTVSGLQSPELFRRVLEFLSTDVPENPIIPRDDTTIEQLRRSLGLARA